MSKKVPSSEMTKEKQLERANEVFICNDVKLKDLSNFIMKASPICKKYIIFGLKD